MASSYKVGDRCIGSFRGLTGLIEFEVQRVVVDECGKYLKIKRLDGSVCWWNSSDISWAVTFDDEDATPDPQPKARPNEMPPRLPVVGGVLDGSLVSLYGMLAFGQRMAVAVEAPDGHMCHFEYERRGERLEYVTEHRRLER
jgi:hypothetical protein